MSDKSLVPPGRIERAIYPIRGQRVMLDADLAALYGVETKALNQAVKRNRGRFPDDFMFRLTPQEVEELNRSQIVTGSEKHRDPRQPPYAFTREGIAMLSGVLRSRRAIQVNIGIMRAFILQGELLLSHRDLGRRLAELEKKYDTKFHVIFKVLRSYLAAPPRPGRRHIGFLPQPKDKK
jgi:hypothetical protein